MLRQLYCIGIFGKQFINNFDDLLILELDAPLVGNNEKEAK